ncbi:MAG: cysteine desulfurase [Actinomycetota bacterium]|nr:cysteine desulfurase [Actinomycetota bacterium]
MFPEAIAAMTEELGRTGNPSSLHRSGRRAKRVVEESREKIAAALGAEPSEVIFTGGGTESDNLAVKGLFWERRKADSRRRRILISSVEHHAVLDAAEWLGRHSGADVCFLPVDANGRILLDEVEQALERDPDSVALVSVMSANNEVGTVQPVGEVAAVARRHGIPLHTDAVQAVGQLPIDFADCQADCLSLSGHKLAGPPGSGVLILRRGTPLTAVSHGGGQEMGLRSGTVSTAAACALGVAIELTTERRARTVERVTALRDELIDGVRRAVPDAILRGDPNPAGRLPGNAHFTFPGCEGDALLYLLEARGIECSTGSACQAGLPRPSHVLLAMGVNQTVARGALRFSLGHRTTSEEIRATVEALGPCVERARLAGLAGLPTGAR